jgi:hypothetical protein
MFPTRRSTRSPPSSQPRIKIWFSVWGREDPPLPDTEKDELLAIFRGGQDRNEEKFMQLLVWIMDGLVASWLIGTCSC